MIPLGALTVILEEGQRERWFESGLIVELSALSLFGLVLLVAGQLTARRPVPSFQQSRKRGGAAYPALMRSTFFISRTMTRRFVEAWRAAHPGGDVIERDLVETPLTFVNAPWLQA